MKRILLIAVVFLAACQTAQMRVAPELATTEPLLVEGANPRRWNTPIRFGQWATSEAREGMTWDFGLRLLGIDANFAFQPYRLTVGNVQAECITRTAALSRKGLSVDPAFGRIPALACGFMGAGEGTLELKTTAMNEEKGEIEFGGMTWGVRSVRNFAGSSIPSGDPLGYEITRDGRVVAAVETINRGRVWMDPALSARDQSRIAAVATALLLYEPATPAEP
jgi:hypothetical protein